jgi:hypothetical protein
MDFGTLPSELLFAIYSELTNDVKAFDSISRVTKHWRYASVDPALWKKLFHHFYPLDPSISANNQWYLAFVNKHKLFRAMRNNNITIRELIAKDKIKFDENQSLSFVAELSLYQEENVIVTPRFSMLTEYALEYQNEHLGCHQINIRTEETKVVSYKYHAKVYGDYTARFEILPDFINLNKMTVIRTPSALEDIKDVNIIGNEYDMRLTSGWIWNSDPKTPSMLYDEDEQTYFFDWSTGERHPVHNFNGGMLYKDLILNINANRATISRNNIELHKYEFQNNPIEAACLNDSLVIFVIKFEYNVYVIDRKSNQQTSFKIPHLTPHEKRMRERLAGIMRGSIHTKLHLFDDILVVSMDSVVYFYDLNRIKLLHKISLEVGWALHQLVRVSQNEFVCIAGSKVLVIRFETEPNPVKILIMPPKANIVTMTVDGSKFVPDVVALPDETPRLRSFYFIKNDTERFGLLYNTNSTEPINTRAHELMKMLPNKESRTNFVHFQCKTTLIVPLEQDKNSLVRINGSAMIFCERLIHERWQYVTPEHWPEVLVNFQLENSK